MFPMGYGERWLWGRGIGWGGDVLRRVWNGFGLTSIMYGRKLLLWDVFLCFSAMSDIGEGFVENE